MRWLVSTVVLIAFILGVVSPAAAHAEFESSTPADGDVLADPVTEILIVFTNAADVAGDGFLVLTPEGSILRPPLEKSEDGTNFTLSFDPPLVDGRFGVRWAVRSGDAHPIEGSFSFTTTALPPTTQPPTTQPPTTEPAALVPAVIEPLRSQPTSTAPLTSTPSASAADHSPGSAENETISMREFLASTDGRTLGEPLGIAARILIIPAALTLVGAAVFASLVGQGLWLGWMLRLLSLASGLLLAGSVIELLWLIQSFDDVGDSVSSSVGLALLLRGAAGAAGLIGALMRVKPPVVGGALIAVCSFLFDGHTVTEGNRWIVAAADVVHVAAGAVWFGGLICLVLAARFESRIRFAGLVARFSVVASGAIVLVGVAGVALTVSIIDAASDLWTSAWGRLLMAKVLLVTITGAFGAYNHFRLVPAIQRASGPDIEDSALEDSALEDSALEDSALEDSALQTLSRTIRFEIALLFGVGALTAFLVGASVAGSG